MPRRFDFTRKNALTGKIENVGYAQLENNNDRAKLYLYGDIVAASWLSEWYEEDKCPQDIADFLNQVENEKEIDIYFNSGGGDVFAGIAICNILKRHTGKITGYVDGIAASIASVILCACDEIVRATGSQVMVHKPWSWDQGNATHFRKLADDLDKCEECMLDIYMTKAKAGVTREDIAALLAQETWLSEDVFDYFDFAASQTAAAQACASTYFDKYGNVPEKIKAKAQPHGEIDIEAVAKRVEEILNKKNTDDVEKAKKAMLFNLSLYGN